jgi:hypothetical protein
VSKQPPEFDELVGADLGPEERERLLRVHELLVAAGPPPELPSSLTSAPAARSVRVLPRRRRGALLALAAALGVLVFAVGFLAGDRGDRPGTFQVLAMMGTPAAAGASASLEIFDTDAAGNWPMELRVRGLPPSPSVERYELWLTKDGRLGALCGSFLAEPDGTTVVPINAPYNLKEFDGWVVVEEGTTAPVLTT